MEITTMKIAIAGTGYVGLITGVCFAEKGYQVICVDTDREKIDRMNGAGYPLIHERDLDILMKRNNSRISYTVDYRYAYQEADVIFICVGTPEKKDGSANLAYVFDAAKQIAKSVHKDCIVAIKSTVPVGTNEKIEKYLNDNKIAGVRIYVVSNPEFLSQGRAIRDTLNASRIVLGVDNDIAKQVMLEVYRWFDAPKLVTSKRSAEMIKYASNDFLALKISYINEIANLCEEVGADVDEVTMGMGFDPRIGKQFLQAGIGYGGSCFPKDTKALHWLSSFHDHELKTVKAAIEINESQKLKLLKKARKHYASFKGLTAAVLGLTFKPGTDDVREAPSLVNIPILLEEGAIIKAYDPVGEQNFRQCFKEEIVYCQDIDEALKNADICFIFTDWEEIKNYDVVKFSKLMRRPIILDGRNCYSVEMMKNLRIIYESIGRKSLFLWDVVDENDVDVAQ